MKFYKSLLFLVFYFHSTKSECTGKHNETFRDTFSLIRECSTSNIIVCLKETIIRMIEGLPNEFQLSPGITVKENVKDNKTLSRNFDEVILSLNDSEPADIVNKVLLEKISEFIDTHLIEIKVPDEKLADNNTSRPEGRKKKRKSIIPYLLLFKAKAIAMGVFFVKFISLMALKALLMAKMALALTIGLGLKRFSDYSSRYPSTLFEFHQPAPHDNNYWRRRGPGDIPNITNQNRNVPYPNMNNQDN